MNADQESSWGGGFPWPPCQLVCGEAPHRPWDAEPVTEMWRDWSSCVGALIPRERAEQGGPAGSSLAAAQRGSQAPLTFPTSAPGRCRDVAARILAGTE